MANTVIKGQSLIKIPEKRNYFRNRIIILCIMGISLLVAIGFVIQHKQNK